MKKTDASRDPPYRPSKDREMAEVWPPERNSHCWGGIDCHCRPSTTPGRLLQRARKGSSTTSTHTITWMTATNLTTALRPLRALSGSGNRVRSMRQTQFVIRGQSHRTRHWPLARIRRGNLSFAGFVDGCSLRNRSEGRRPLWGSRHCLPREREQLGRASNSTRREAGLQGRHCVDPSRQRNYKSGAISFKPSQRKARRNTAASSGGCHTSPQSLAAPAEVAGHGGPLRSLAKQRRSKSMMLN